MLRKFIAVALGIPGIAISACAGHLTNGNAMGGDTVMLPPVGDLSIYATMPKDAVGEELPSEGVGTIKSKKWVATLGGFTQHNVLAGARISDRHEDYDSESFERASPTRSTS